VDDWVWEQVSIRGRGCGEEGIGTSEALSWEGIGATELSSG
jgi:hypothetical protein